MGVIEFVNNWYDWRFGICVTVLRKIDRKDPREWWHMRVKKLEPLFQNIYSSNKVKSLTFLWLPLSDVNKMSSANSGLFSSSCHYPH